MGFFKTRARVRALFTGKGLDNFLRSSVKRCNVCALSKPAQNTHWGKLASVPPEKPMQRLYVDFIGPFPRSKTGNSYALVCVDGFTRFSWILPTRNATSSCAINALKVVFASFGPPKHIVSDNASCFVSGSFNQFCWDFGISRITTSPHYPKPNFAERMNRNLKAALIAYHSQCHSSWDSLLPWLSIAFNSALHEALGVSPASLMLGFVPKHPLVNKWSLDELLPDIFDKGDLNVLWGWVRSTLRDYLAKKEARYNADQKPIPFSVGDRVFLRSFPISNKANAFSAKLANRFRGPFWLARFVSPVSVILVDPDSGKELRAHVSHLKSS